LIRMGNLFGGVLCLGSSYSVNVKNSLREDGKYWVRMGMKLKFSLMNIIKLLLLSAVVLD